MPFPQRLSGPELGGWGRRVPPAPCTPFGWVCAGMPRFPKCRSEWHFLTVHSEGLRNQRLGYAAPPSLGCNLSASLPAALETVLLIPMVPRPQFLLLGQGGQKTMRHPRDSAPLTQMAESTGRNPSVPTGRPPRPPSPLARPTMRPCAAPAVGPGIWRRDGGNSRQIFKTEPREQSRPLCTEGAERAAGGRAEGSWAHARAGDPAFSSPRRRGLLNPFPPAPRRLPLLAVTCLIEKSNSHSPCFSRKHTSLK